MTNKTKKRVVVKIGSNSLTSQHGEISRRKIEKLVDEVVHLKDQNYEVVLVSSGAVAAGYRKLGFLQRPDTLPEKQAAASIGQGLLMETYSNLFLSHGYTASQMLITRDDFSDENRYQNVRNTMSVLLDRGIIPIVNENDTVTVNHLKFGDNDTLSAKVAGLIGADMLAILSDIDGLYDADPTKDPHAKMLEQVHEITPEIEAAAGGPASDVGTGGMKSKIEAVKIAMASGIPSFLGKADKANILLDAVRQKAKGTYFEVNDQQTNLDYKEQWIAFHSGAQGEIIVEAERGQFILEQSDSLLVSDIYAVNGTFKDGQVVSIKDVNSNEIGMGIINYSSKQLNDEQVQQADTAIDRKQFVCLHLETSSPVTV